MYEGPAERSEGEGGVTASWLSADDNGSIWAGLGQLISGLTGRVRAGVGDSGQTSVCT